MLPLTGLLALLVTPATGLAANYTVTTASDTLANHTVGSSVCGTPCSLRAAVLSSNVNNGADSIFLGDFDPSLLLNGANENSGVTGDLDITGDLTIIGQKAGGGKNVIDASGMGDRAFHILSGAHVTFENVSIRGGEVTNQGGAGIMVAGTSSVDLTGVELTNNTVNFDSAAITGNTDELQVFFLSTGGGIFVDAQATAIIDNSTISQNQAPAGGGVNNFGRADIRDSEISNNTATGTVSSNPLLNNIGNGGGINNLGGYLSVGSSTLSNNTTSTSGGAVFHSNLGLNVGNVIITNTQISDNQANVHGAGIANLGPLSLSNSTIRNNIITPSADPNIFQGTGAGIYNSGGNASLDIVNSTISTNSGARSGGGIFNSRDLTLTNVTLFNNSATRCSGCGANGEIGGNELAVFTTSTSNNPNVILANTILADGLNSNASEPPCAGSASYTSNINTLGGNIETDDTCGLLTGAPYKDNTNETNVGLDTTLAVDSNFPGTTPVHALIVGSPAINKGANASCPIVDQRFLLRDDLCDIGAYEFGATQSQASNYVDLKATISDSPDPVAPNNKQQPLTYVVMLTNLYVDKAAEDVTVLIDLPDSYQFNNLSYTSTSVTPSCQDPNANNVITCTISLIPGLGRVEFFISGQPTVLGTITAKVDVLSATQDAFPQNNTNITEDTVVSNDADDTDNFGGNPAGSGGGIIHPLVLILGTLILLGRRRS